MQNQNTFITFESSIAIRPDDIDLNNHVHSTKYLDYVLAARFLQMEINYGMSMEDFAAKGYNWVATECHITFKRSLKLSDSMALVSTGVLEFNGPQIKVQFTIKSGKTKKLAADGWFWFTMIDRNSGRPARIPEDIIQHYSLK